MLLNRSFWLRQALEHDADVAEPLARDLKVDTCIVGGGFTGLWTAINLKRHEPAMEIAIIEKDICGGGASGRNGGFCMTWMSKSTTLLKLCGGQEGGRLLRESALGVKAIGEFCRDHDIDCQFQHNGWVWTASNAAQAGAWDSTLEALDKLGLHPYEPLDQNQLAELTGSEGHHSGVLEPGVATLQPAMLARGLRRVALELGVKIFESTAMLELIRGPTPSVRTAGGTVTADAVVLALNAWAHELPEFRRTVLPIAADVIATRPAHERLQSAGLHDCVAVSDSRTLVNFYRTTTEGRMVWGVGGGAIPFAGRLGTSFDYESPRRDQVAAMMRRFVPSLESVEIEAAWRGPATRTMTGLPFFGTLSGSDNIHYGHGYTGNGVGPCYLGGKILASKVLQQRDEWSETPIAQGPVQKRLPPEPVRYFGGGLVRAACARVDHAQDESRQPSSLDRYLASFAPAGLAPTKQQ